jgi:hypothetical protein
MRAIGLPLQGLLLVMVSGSSIVMSVRAGIDRTPVWDDVSVSTLP